MKQNKGVIGLGLILAIVLGVAVVGGGAYYLGKSSSKIEKQNPENILPENQNQDLDKINQNINQPVVENSTTSQIAKDCDPNSKPSIKVLSPNGGEIYKSGDKITVKWDSKCIDSNKKILIGINRVVMNQDQSVEDVHSMDTTNNSESYTWLIPKDIPVGQYEVYVTYLYGNGDSAYDKSDSLITINSTAKNVSVDSNLIKLTSCGVSFSKTSDWSVISNTGNEVVLDIPSTDHIVGTSGINIKCVLDNKITDTDAKFGNITYYYDSNTKKWMVSMPNERDGGMLPATVATPLFTVNDLPVFRGTGRWLTYIIPVSSNSILSLREGDTEGGYTQTLTNLVKTLKKL